MYIFPTLNNAEILQCMEELRIPFTEQDLSKPSSIKVIKVFEDFLDILMGITREELEQPHFSVMENLENPELHQQSLEDITFFRHLQRLMHSVGIQDFSIKDIMRPEAPRVRRILSAVINFAKFREEHLAEFEKHTQLTVRKKRIKMLIQDIAQLNIVLG
jgi:kinetochore protein Nuf2